MITAFALLVLICLVCAAYLVTVLTRERPGRLKRSTWTRGEPTEIAEAE